MIVSGAVLPLLGWVILAAFTAHEVVFTVRHLTCKPKHCHCPLSHKLLAGKPLHGEPVTDATFFRKADKVTTSAHVGPWLKLPGWKRRMYSSGPVLAAAALMINLMMAAPVLAAIAALMTACRARWARRLLRRALTWTARRFCVRWNKVMPARLHTENLARLWARMPLWLRSPRHRNRIQTMGMLLASVTGTAASAAQAGVTWTPDYATVEPGEEVARWVLPRGFKATGGEKNLAQDVWKSRIGFDIVFTWHLDVDEPVMVMTRAREMPSIVYLADVRERVEALPDNKTAIGLDDQSNLVCWDWACENPHALVVAGSRHGKTELNRSITAQVVRKGGQVFGVDCKRVSFQGLEGVPGFHLRNNPRNIREMWELIRDFHDEMEHRSEARAKDPTAEFPRWLLIIEEVNQFSAMTDDWWEEMEPENEADEGTLLWKPKRGKRTPRTWRWIKSLCWEGAEFGMHVIVDGQDGEFQALKGVRNVLGMRLLGGYQPQQWKSCVGTTPVPEAPSTKGRFCLVSGGQTWVQALVAHKDKNESAAIWRDFARDGRRLDGERPAGGSDGDSTVLVGTVHGEIQAVKRSDLGEYVSGTVPGTVAGTVGQVQREALKLSTMLERGLIPGMTIDNLETVTKWRLRWADWPKMVGVDGPAHTYYPDEVVECVQRHRPGLQQRNAALPALPRARGRRVVFGQGQRPDESDAPPSVGHVCNAALDGVVDDVGEALADFTAGALNRF